MAKYKEPSIEQQRQVLKYPIKKIVAFKRSYWVESKGIIVSYCDSSKQIVQIRDLEDRELYPRSLNTLDQLNFCDIDHNLE